VLAPYGVLGRSVLLFLRGVACGGPSGGVSEQAGSAAVGELLEGLVDLRLELGEGGGVFGEQLGPLLLLLGQGSLDLLQRLLQWRDLVAGFGAKAELHGRPLSGSRSPDTSAILSGGASFDATTWECAQGHFGPRLEATLALLAGRYRLGLRPVVTLAGDLWGLDLSTGMVSTLRQRTAEALFLPWVDVAAYVRRQNVHIDETHWREAKERVYLWAVATPLATLFAIVKGRTAQVAQQLLGKDYSSVATCDRLKSYWWIKRLQWCWAHLRRDFQAMIDRGKPGKAIGESLLGQSNTLFHHWHRFCAGKLSRGRFQQTMKPLREAVRQTLQRGTRCRCRQTAGTCKELLNHEQWLWTFVDVEGVEPTNNEAERVERHGVLWRKTSGGTDSPQGSRFVERMLTVVETCRRQGKKALDYLSACIESWRQGRAPPYLLPDSS
jgi:transposase